MQSDKFTPKATVPAYELDALFAPIDKAQQGKQSDAAIRQLLNK